MINPYKMINEWLIDHPFLLFIANSVSALCWILFAMFATAVESWFIFIIAMTGFVVALLGVIIWGEKALEE